VGSGSDWSETGGVEGAVAVSPAVRRLSSTSVGAVVDPDVWPDADAPPHSRSRSPARRSHSPLVTKPTARVRTAGVSGGPPTPFTLDQQLLPQRPVATQSLLVPPAANSAGRRRRRRRRSSGGSVGSGSDWSEAGGVEGAVAVSPAVRRLSSISLSSADDLDTWPAANVTFPVSVHSPMHRSHSPLVRATGVRTREWVAGSTGSPHPLNSERQPQPPPPCPLKQAAATSVADAIGARE
jgi:hypothetical protein